MRCDIYAARTVVTHSHDLTAVIDPAERVGGVRRPAGRRRAAVALAVVLLPILAATVAGLVLLWPSGAKPKSSLNFAAGGVTFPRGMVTALITGPCAQSDKGTEIPTPVPLAGRAPVCGTATVSITDGTDAGHVVGVTVPPDRR